MGNFKVAERTAAFGVHDPLGNAFVVKSAPCDRRSYMYLSTCTTESVRRYLWLQYDCGLALSFMLCYDLI